MSISKPLLSDNAPVAVIGCAGGGGVEAAMLELGIRPALSIEFDETNPWLSEQIANCHETNFSNYGKLQRMTVEAWESQNYPGCPEQIDFAHFSPSCANYSSINDFAEDTKDLKTAIAIANFIREKRPYKFTLENVPSYGNSNAIKIILRTLKEAEYYCQKFRVECHKLEVPQTRTRLFIIAERFRTRDFPKLTSFPIACWKDFIGDRITKLAKLPLLDKQLQALEKNGVNPNTAYIIPRTGFYGLPRLIPWGNPAPTLRKFLFVDQRNNSRGRFWNIYYQGESYQVDMECVRLLATFPDWYELPESIAIAGSILGYAIPPVAYKHILKTCFAL